MTLKKFQVDRPKRRDKIRSLPPPLPESHFSFVEILPLWIYKGARHAKLCPPVRNGRAHACAPSIPIQWGCRRRVRSSFWQIVKIFGKNIFLTFACFCSKSREIAKFRVFEIFRKKIDNNSQRSNFKNPSD